jgi:hypothetical protein
VDRTPSSILATAMMGLKIAGKIALILLLRAAASAPRSSAFRPFTPGGNTPSAGSVDPTVWRAGNSTCSSTPSEPARSL